MTQRFILPFVLLSAQLIAADCTHNNCLRAVIARPSSTDCSTFMTSTYTPPTVTLTTTGTTTTTATGVVTTTVPANQLRRRADRTIPPYATACANSAAFASACSCQGFTSTVITVAAPTVVVPATSVSTVLTTVTTTATSPPICTQSAGQIIKNPSFEEGGAFGPAPYWDLAGRFNCFNYPYDVDSYDGISAVRCEINNGGTYVITQDITVCAGLAYDFSAYFGFDNGGVGSGVPFDTEYEVSFNGVVIVPRQLLCGGSQSGCPIPTHNNNVYAGFSHVTGTLPAQSATVFDKLKITLYHDLFVSGQYQNFIMDLVTLTVT